ncbi:hypothetical protein OYT88_03065 [Sporolactobacillus sp. CQH2019]|uniref:hypothetical protein n=1 Tax=Sporolactobacillus sp. CQH2019 TaxID=3023512 RepID=UPI0023680B6A|nr:hypothetical protein [Sporolactobacillus sp. CQH2019]MDD9147534.1 hypothetical protein [Sporolactobacillus sp. CQH2019]
MKRLTALISACLIVILLLPVTALAAPSDGFAARLAGLESHIRSTQLAQSLQSDQPDDWAVMALARDGALSRADQAAYLSRLQSRKDLSGTALEKAIIALKALKQDPTNFYGRNLIGELGRDTSLNSANSFSADIYALVALNAYEDKLPAGAVNTPANLIQKIVSRADPNGGWGYMDPPATIKADVDTTGAALAALAPYQNRPDVRNAVNKAVQYLARVELPDGGFSNYGENSDSTAEAVIGLTSVGVDPTAGKFDKQGRNPLNILYTYQSGKGYRWQPGFSEDPMTNDEVLKAFVAYKVFPGGGKLFAFPTAKAAAPVEMKPASGLGQETASGKSAAAVPSAIASSSARKAVTAGKVSSTRDTIPTVPFSEIASHFAAEKTGSGLLSKAESVNTRPENKIAEKSPLAAAAGNKENTAQTQAAQSTAVNPVLLIIGILVVLLGAALLIFRKAIWRRRT